MATSPHDRFGDYVTWDSEPYETPKATVTPRLMVCQACFATVPEEETDSHDGWHRHLYNLTGA